MYKILIVHQEEDKINNMRNAIMNNIHDVLVLYAFSGTQALEIIRSEKPDIVFLTIELVDVSGIDVADEVKGYKHSPKVVFISQYDYFEFARKALQAGASDYLLEPVTEHDIVEVAGKLVDEVNVQRENTQIEIEKEEKLKDFNELTGYSFIYTVLFDGKTTKDTEEYRRILNISDKGFWINIEFENRLYDVNLNNYNISLSIRKILGNDYRYIVGPKILNRYIVYVSVSDENIAMGEVNFSTHIAKKLLEGLEKKYRYKISIGIGSIQKIEKLNISYEEAIRSLRRNDEKQVTHVTESATTKVIDHNQYIDYEKKLLESIELGKDDCMDIYVMLLSCFDALSEYDKRNKIIETLVLSCHAVNRLGQSECDYADYTKFYEEFQNVMDTDILAWSINKFQFILKSARNNAVDNVSETVKTAIYYVYEHYNESISLNDVAGKAGVTLQYFSKIFKDETGMNFVEWLNRLRIGKAKELMNTTQLTIKEICFKVGYNDPNYFSRIFKRYEGIAPTEYLDKDKKDN